MITTETLELIERNCDRPSQLRTFTRHELTVARDTFEQMADASYNRGEDMDISSELYHARDMVDAILVQS